MVYYIYISYHGLWKYIAFILMYKYILYQISLICYYLSINLSIKGKGVKKPTKIAQAVVALQERLPNARIVYCSATGKYFDVWYNIKLWFTHTYIWTTQ